MRQILWLFPFAASALAQYIPAGPVFPTSGGAGGACAHYVAITTASGQEGSSDSSNFPVVVNTGTLGIGAYFKNTANGGYILNTVTQVGGNGGTEPADAVVGTTSTCSTLLPWETEYYAGVSVGSWILHVRLPTLHHSTADTFYICFGASGVTTQQNTGSYAPSAVWDTYANAVYHVPNGSSLLLDDSTANAFNLTNANSTAATGEIDGGAALNGSSAYLDLGTAMNAAFTAGTVSMWVKSAGGQTSYHNDGGATGAVYGPFFVREKDASDTWVLLGFDSNNSSAHWFASLRGQWSTTVNNITSSATQTANWTHVAVTWDGSHFVLYINGAVDTSISSSASLAATSVTYTRIGYWAGGYFDGSIDEVKNATVARSADWIAAEYNNQKPSSTFLTAGSLH